MSIAISQPPDGMTSGVGGVPYYIEKDVTLPLSVYYTDTTTGIDLTTFTVSLIGSGSVNVTAGSSEAAGTLLLTIPTSSTSDGTKNFLVEASIKNKAGNLAQAGSSFTLTLAHLGAGSITVPAGSTFSIPVNVYLDPSWSYGLGSYDIQLSFTSSTINYVSVTGSNPSSPVYSLEFSAQPSNIGVGFPEFVSSNSLGSNATSPKGLMNIANVRFQALSVGTTQVTLTIVYLRDSTGVEIPQTRIQSGSITVY